MSEIYFIELGKLKKPVSQLTELEGFCVFLLTEGEPDNVGEIEEMVHCGKGGECRYDSGTHQGDEKSVGR